MINIKSKCKQIYFERTKFVKQRIKKHIYCETFPHNGQKYSSVSSGV